MNKINDFRRLNLLLGWSVFVISSVVYLLTIEPSASFWDCSEFIATSYKMEVGHPPGAPLFMMVNRFFSLFAPDVTKVAMLVNAGSALASGATILFLFWTISHLGRRLLQKEGEELTPAQTWAVMGAALVGSLAYAFTDTFWFSAVEGEVYAQSSLFTAVVFWAILKWENVAREPHANRWLVLVAYLMGLSIGVHLLNLLAIPAIVFVYYFRMYPRPGKWGWLKATAVAFAILVAVLYGIVPQTVAIGAWFDKLFVNTFGLPVNSGILTFFVLLLALLGYGVYRTWKRGKVLWNTIFLCVFVMILGYGSYASVLIRASANPPMNSNDPSNPYALLSLLNRDQYGSRPLVTGEYYSSPVEDVTYSTKYRLQDGKYVPYREVSGRVFDPRFTTFFPRMWSDSPAHAREYKNWGKVKGRNVPYEGEMVNIPTFRENLRYFFSYQLNFMYWRYFLWNFVGRQNDLQSQGEITNGNWMSGIKPIDELYLGPQDNLPSELERNRGRNKYYFLPFLLGLAGLFYQLRRDGRNFTVVMWLFFMTGVAIILYLNQPPLQPRERDYAYAGSFYAYSVWIGLGVLWVYDLLNRRLKNRKANALAATLVCLSVPGILIAQNWDDHTRARRYVARDFGYNYLNATLPNSILICYGDNDTFPLWYNQEVENVRPDVKIVNESYLQSNWYIGQMRIASNTSAPVPHSIPEKKYIDAEYLYISPHDKVQDYVPVRTVLDFFISDDPRTKITLSNGESLDYIPTNRIALPVNKRNVIESGVVPARDSALILDTLYLDLPGNMLTKAQFTVLDIIASNDWKQPVYFTQPHLAEGLGLKEYLQLDGFSYRLVPIKTPVKDVLSVGRIDPDYLYDKLMNGFRYGNVADPRVNTDYFVQYSFSSAQVRNVFARLAKELSRRGEHEKAVEVLDRALEEMPFSQINHSYINTLPVIEAYYMAGAPDKANAVFDDYLKHIKEYLTYFSQFKGEKAKAVAGDVQEKLYYMYELYVLATKYGQTERAKDLESYLSRVGAI